MNQFFTSSFCFPVHPELVEGQSGILSKATIFDYLLQHFSDAFWSKKASYKLSDRCDFHSPHVYLKALKKAKGNASIPAMTGVDRWSDSVSLQFNDR
jgi:hypothetical protein